MLFKVIKTDCYCTLFVSHLIAPLPLERHGDLEQNGYDPREVDITHNLKRRKQDFRNYIKLAVGHFNRCVFSSKLNLSFRFSKTCFVTKYNDTHHWKGQTVCVLAVQQWLCWMIREWPFQTLWLRIFYCICKCNGWTPSYHHIIMPEELELLQIHGSWKRHEGNSGNKLPTLHKDLRFYGCKIKWFPPFPSVLEASCRWRIDL